MDNFNNLDQKVDQTLNSLDGMQRAVANPFLFTRVKARMEEQKNPWAMTFNFISRPVVAISALAIFLTVNVWVVVKNLPENEVASVAYSEDDMAIAVEAEYSTVSYSLLDVNPNER